MKVFISWSGPLSSAVGKVLRDTLPCILQDLEVFLSKHDLGSGERWGQQLAEQLDQTSFGVICLTPTNLAAPWLLFEAGSLAKHIDGRVCGLLSSGLRAADISGPLAQFQHLEWSKENIHKLIRDINAKLDTPVEAQQLDRIFEKWWPDFESGYQSALTEHTAKHSGVPHRRPDRDILEEILERVRASERDPSETVRSKKSASNDDAFVQSLLGNLRKTLSPAQVELLTAVAVAKTQGKQDLAKMLCEHAQAADVDDLVHRGLFVRGKDGRIMMNRLIIRQLGREVESKKPTQG